MSEVCENHGRIRCGECAYIEELKKRLAEQELEIERLQSTCNDLNNELFSANIERDNSLYERDSLMERLKIALFTHESYDRTVDDMHDEIQRLRAALEVCRYALKNGYFQDELILRNALKAIDQALSTTT